jgi:hypothetical protein
MTGTTQLSSKFRHVRLALAREKGHPEGDPHEGFDLLVPLDKSGHIDPAEWKANQEKCRAGHFPPDEDDRIGRPRRKPGGQWHFDYAAGEADDELAFPLSDHRFIRGEYVSIRNGERCTPIASLWPKSHDYHTWPGTNPATTIPAPVPILRNCHVL